MAQFFVVQGEDRTINVTATDSIDKTPVNLTGVTEISASFANATTGAVVFTKTGSEITITDAIRGKFTIVMSDAKTINLKTGDLTMELIIDWGAPFGGLRRIKQVEKAITVKKKIF